LRTIAAWTFRPIPFMEQNRKRYGDRFSAHMGPEGWWVFHSDPDHIRQIFTAPADVLHPGEGARILLPVVGEHSLILLDRDSHLTQRKLMLPSFHGERMRALEQTMIDVTRAEIERWPRAEVFPLHGALQRLTLEVILHAVFGLEEGPRHEDLHEVLAVQMDLGGNPLTFLPPFRRGSRWRRIMELQARSDAHIFALINERREVAEDRDDILSTLLSARDETGEPMSDQELRDELMTLLVAGHETTASALAWAAEQLVANPDVLARTVQAADAGDDAWLDAVAQETLRRRPVLPVAAPRRLKSDYEIGGTTLPAGSTAIACVYLVHHDEQIYPDPYRFHPQRFIDESPGTYTWIPFGGGRRRCIGASFAQLEMRIVLRELLAARELRAGEPGREGSRRRAITLSPRRGMPVSLAPRVREPAREPVAV
jgi:cytochrome P450